MTMQTLPPSQVSESPALAWPTIIATFTGRAAITITDLPQVVNLQLYQGDDFELQLNVSDPDTGDPLDLTGAQPLSQIRASTDAEDVAGIFACTIDGGSIWLHLTSAVSTALPRSSVWDVQVTRDQRVRTLAAGAITLTPQVSR